MTLSRERIIAALWPLSLLGAMTAGVYAGWTAKTRAPVIVLPVPPEIEKRISDLEAQVDNQRYRCIKITTEKTDVSVYPVERLKVVRGLGKEGVKK